MTDHQPIDSGAYTAERAAALSGVPQSTVRYWAKREILVPSISREKLMLWSYADLVRLRIVYWLRQPKTLAESREIPSSKMTKVLAALARLRELGLGILDARGMPRVFIDHDGHVFVKNARGVPEDAQAPHQGLLDFIDLIGPFDTISGIRGPDLRVPRPSLRIIPGKLSGEPHLLDTRLETNAVAALTMRGFSVEQICDFYPFAPRPAIEQAIELEEQLGINIEAA